LVQELPAYFHEFFICNNAQQLTETIFTKRSHLYEQIFLLAILLFSFSATHRSDQSTSNDWSKHKAKKWFKKKEWLNGLDAKPHSSIDKVQFAKQYHLNQGAWDKACAYLKNTDLNALKKEGMQLMEQMFMPS
jgi:hypothetical protein